MAENAEFKIQKLVRNSRDRGDVVDISALARKLHEAHPTYGLARLRNLILGKVGESKANASWDKSE